MFLLEVCAALGEAKYKKNFLCVYEIEGESASYMPNYEIGKKGNFITVPLEERAFLGLHINEPDDTPMAANDSLHVQTYLDGIMVHISNQITQTLKDYSMQITSVFGVFRG